MLGGMLCKPKACRSKENTIKIRVKLVISMSAAGKNVSAVRPNKVCTGTVYEVPPARGLATTKGTDCAQAAVEMANLQKALTNE